MMAYMNKARQLKRTEKGGDERTNVAGIRGNRSKPGQTICAPQLSCTVAVLALLAQEQILCCSAILRSIFTTHEISSNNLFAKFIFWNQIHEMFEYAISNGDLSVLQQLLYQIQTNPFYEQGVDNTYTDSSLTFVF